MRSPLIGEGSHHMDKGIHLVKVSHKLTAQPLPLGDSRINIFYLGRDSSFGFEDSLELPKTWVGNFSHAKVRLQSSRGIGIGFGLPLGQAVKYSGLATLR